MPEEQFFSLLTTVGAARLANAVALDTSVAITELAVGDGEAEAYYTPTEEQTALKNEVFRGTINNKYVHADNANWVVFELAIPAAEGPFTIREAGIFDEDDNLIGVAKLPESYKPALDQGSGKDLLIKFTLQTSNAAQVELLVDPSVVLATHEKVEQDIAAHEALSDPHTQYVVPSATETVVGKVELADITEAKAGTDTSRAVTPAGLGSAIFEERKKAMLERLLSAMADGSANPAMNAKPETYADLSGVDTGLSSNYQHDAAGAFLTSSGTIETFSAIGEWLGNTGGFTFTGSNIDRTTSNDNIKLASTFDGDFEFYFTFTGSGDVSGPDCTLIFYDDAEDAAFVNNKYNFHLDFTHKFHLVYTPGDNRAYVYDLDTTYYTHTPANSTACSVRRVGTELSFWVGESKVYTFPTATDKTLRLAWNGVNTGADLNDVSWVTTGPALNPIVISEPIEAFSEPGTGFLLGLWQPVDPVTYGVNVLVDISKDDGVTWEDAAAVKVGEATVDVPGVGATVVDIVAAQVDFVTVGDQTIRSRIRGVGEKHVDYHGTILDAE